MIAKASAFLARDFHYQCKEFHCQCFSLKERASIARDGPFIAKKMLSLPEYCKILPEDFTSNDIAKEKLFVANMFAILVPKK